MVQTKVCGTCAKTLSVQAFPSDGHGGERNHCRDCFNRGRLRGDGTAKGSRVVRAQQEVLPPLTEHHLKADVARLRMANQKLLEELSDVKKLTEIAREAASIKVKGIAPRERASSKVREATALACASDWHIEEEVRPEQVAGRNVYNLEISAQRMTRFFESVRYAINFNRQIFKIRDLVLWLGGDLITNYLHDDNIESNLLSPVQAIAYAQASIAAGIGHLLLDPELERIVIPCNDGNHGRLSDKTRSATRTANSIEWLLYTNLALMFRNEPRVQFQIAEGEHLYYDIYGRTVRFVHGDQVKYNGGIGGIMIPMYKALASWNTLKNADLTVCGHFHQLISLPDLIVNGSLIGYSPYSLSIKARFEPPAQAFTILDPLRFKSVSMPLWVSTREDDVNTKEKK